MNLIPYFGVLIVLYGKCRAVPPQQYYDEDPFDTIYDEIEEIFENINVYNPVVDDTCRAYRINPDVVNKSPGALAVVEFADGASMFLGNKLFVPPGLPVIPVNIEYPNNPSRNYTLLLLDADDPSRLNRVESQFIQWIVCDIPGDNVAAGRTLVDFAFTDPEYWIGQHRYVLLVYQQSGPCNTASISKRNFNRYRFCAEEYARNNNLGNPVAGNFGIVEFDDPCFPNQDVIYL